MKRIENDVYRYYESAHRTIMEERMKNLDKTYKIEELIRTKRSMLSGRLPIGYGAIESVHEAVVAAEPAPSPEKMLRLHIVWDNDARNLQELPRVLEQMRLTGAAMVTKVEEVIR